MRGPRPRLGRISAKAALYIIIIMLPSTLVMWWLIFGSVAGMLAISFGATWMTDADSSDKKRGEGGILALLGNVVLASAVLCVALAADLHPPDWACIPALIRVALSRLRMWCIPLAACAGCSATAFGAAWLGDEISDARRTFAACLVFAGNAFVCATVLGGTKGVRDFAGWCRSPSHQCAASVATPACACGSSTAIAFGASIVGRQGSSLAALTGGGFLLMGGGLAAAVAGMCGICAAHSRPDQFIADDGDIDAPTAEETVVTAQIGVATDDALA